MEPVDDGASPASVTGDPDRFVNRELSWLDFNARVLECAADPRVPLLERAKFCAIFSQNLDEFFQVRVAGLADQVIARVGRTSPDGKRTCAYSPSFAMSWPKVPALRIACAPFPGLSSTL